MCPLAPLLCEAQLTQGTPPEGGAGCCVTAALSPGKNRFTTEFAQGLLGVVIPVTALGHVVCLQLHCGLDVPQGLITGLQVNGGEERQAACTRGVLNPLVPA